MNAETLLHQRRNIGKYEIRRRRPDNNEIDIFRLHLGGLYRSLCRFNAQGRRGFLFRGKVAPLDTGTGPNPFVAGLNDILEIGIRHDAFRQIAAGTSDS